MPLPNGVPRVTVTTAEPLIGPAGTPAQGKILFIGPKLITVPSLQLTLTGYAESAVLDPTGAASIDLIPCDLDGMSPSGWTYEVRTAFTDGTPNWIRYVKVTSSPTTVRFCDVLVPDPTAGNFVVVTGPQGPAGPAGPTGATGPQGPAGPAGGGSAIRTAELLIARETITLPTSPSAYTIMRTSVADGSFPIACSIPAAVGDRVRWALSWMRTGGVLFYDVALLNAAGAFSRFTSTHGTTPALEGYPAYYNQEPSFPGIAGDQQFVIQNGEVDANGKVTFALVYKGPTDGSQKAYFSPDYPGYWLLTNLGPEPA